MLVTFQHITSRWTKFSRGAPHSAKRAAVPVSFAFPVPAIPKKALRAIHFHWVGAYEQTGFVPGEKSEVQDLTGLLSLYSEPVTLKFEDEQLAVEYKGGVWTSGAPHRPQIIRTVFSLSPESWGRLAVNGRFGYGGEWTYYRKVMNIAFTHEPPRSRLFEAKPDAEFRDEHDLW